MLLNLSVKGILRSIYRNNPELPLNFISYSRGVRIEIGWCNLRCENCGGLYLQPKDGMEKKTVKESKDYFKPKQIEEITVAGGEPLLWQNNKKFISLLKWLHKRYFVVLETNGTQKLEDKTARYIDRLKIYPKVNYYPNSYTFTIAQSLKKVDREYIFDVKGYVELLNAYQYIYAYSIQKEYIFLKSAERYIREEAIPFFKKRNIETAFLSEEEILNRNTA